MRHKETVITMHVKLKIPPRSNASEIQGYIRAAMCSYGGGLASNKEFIFSHEELTVRLVKKETTYV